MKKLFSINTVSFFHLLEKNIWGNRINTNVCFGTISILVSTVIAAITTGANIINGWFDTDLQCSWYISMLAVLFIMVLNVQESILAAEDAKVAILRSLLVIGFILLGVIIGALTSVVVAICVAILALIFFISLLSGAVGGAMESGNKKGKTELHSGDIIDFMLGQEKISGSTSFDGLEFHGDNGKTYVRESTSSSDWFEKP